MENNKEEIIESQEYQTEIIIPERQFIDDSE